MPFKFKKGETVFWNDPNDAACSGTYAIVAINDDGHIYELINKAGSEVDALESELMKPMQLNQLALCNDGTLLVQIESIVSPTCIYCRILNGEKRGGMTVEYETTLQLIPETENLKVF